MGTRTLGSKGRVGELLQWDVSLSHCEDEVIRSAKEFAIVWTENERDGSDCSDYTFFFRIRDIVNAPAADYMAPEFMWTLCSRGDLARVHDGRTWRWFLRFDPRTTEYQLDR